MEESLNTRSNLRAAWTRFNKRACKIKERFLFVWTETDALARRQKTTWLIYGAVCQQPNIRRLETGAVEILCKGSSSGLNKFHTCTIITSKASLCEYCYTHFTSWAMERSVAKVLNDAWVVTESWVLSHTLSDIPGIFDPLCWWRKVCVIPDLWDEVITTCWCPCA